MSRNVFKLTQRKNNYFHVNFPGRLQLPQLLIFTEMVKIKTPVVTHILPTKTNR